MIKKDIQKFDKLVQRTFKNEVNTFDEIIDIFVNMIVQENSKVNNEMMEKVKKYCKTNKQVEIYLTQYFEFSQKVIMKLESLERLPDEQEYKKQFDPFVKSILEVLPASQWKENIYGAMGYLMDVINIEYDLISYPVDNNFSKKLEQIFSGIVPMAQLYMIIHNILMDNIENKNSNISTKELFEQAKILFSFIIFGNITRKVIVNQTKIKPKDERYSNNSDYKKVENKIYQLKISIKGAKPPIWRRVLVKSDSTFYNLHNTIQSIFNWENYHLFQFDGSRGYTDATSLEDDFGYGEDLLNASDYNISNELQYEKDKISYTYDFGDDWEHEILLEKILEVDDNIIYPICTAGRRNGPLEDCGGMWGYGEIVYVIENQDFSQAEHLMDEDGNFYYEDFDPAYFNKDEVNKKIN